MIDSGESAPSFRLMGVRDGSIEEVALDTVLGDAVVILAFYPGDFNPACSGSETGLDELDLFTMQKDVTVLAISGDSVYSHQAFADQYSLHMPLLSDTDGSVAERYGVAAGEGEGYLTQRAVVVIDHAGTAQFTWHSENPRSAPTAERIRAAIKGIGDDETAESRYRVGHAHYMEGRRAFTSAMNAYEQREWMMAQTDFTQAAEEFDEAGDEFNTAARFAEDGDAHTDFERAEDKAEALWRAADWLSDSASAFASGEGARGDSLRNDAETPLETARDLDEPPAPDDFPLAETDQPDASVETDIDASETNELDRSEDKAKRVDQEASLDSDETEPTTEAGAEIHGETASKKQSATETPPMEEQRGDRDEQTEPADGSTEQIDDSELEEITAELEEQTEATEHSDAEPGGGNIVSDETEMGENQEETAQSGDVELDLSDPDTEDSGMESDEADDGESDSEDEEKSDTTDERISSGDHGVPDSL